MQLGFMNMSIIVLNNKPHTTFNMATVKGNTHWVTEYFWGIFFYFWGNISLMLPV